jgi:hypothetical protein
MSPWTEYPLAMHLAQGTGFPSNEGLSKVISEFDLRDAMRNWGVFPMPEIPSRYEYLTGAQPITTAPGSMNGTIRGVLCIRSSRLRMPV